LLRYGRVALHLRESCRGGEARDEREFGKHSFYNAGWDAII
jgi:hypothetical protein